MNPGSKVLIAIVVGLVMAGLVITSMAGCGMGYGCMSGMMGMGKTKRGGEMRGMGGMEGMGKEEVAQQPPTEGRKKVGEEFTCPIDGMRMKVTEKTPATEYRGKTYYFCSQEDKEAFLKDPERYAK